MIKGYQVIAVEPGRIRVQELHSTKGWRAPEWRYGRFDLKPGRFVARIEPSARPEPIKPPVKIMRSTF